MFLNIFFAEEFHLNPFCKARVELAKIKKANTIERPGRSTVFWKQKIRLVWTESRGIPLPGAADLA